MRVRPAPKGSLYFHFPGGKEQMAAEVMRDAADRIRETLVEVAEAAPNAAVALTVVIDALAAELEASDYYRGCPLATVALDAAVESEPIAAACRHGYESWQAAMAATLTRGGMAPRDAESFATVGLAAIEGHCCCPGPGASWPRCTPSEITSSPHSPRSSADARAPSQLRHHASARRIDGGRSFRPRPAGPAGVPLPAAGDLRRPGAGRHRHRRPSQAAAQRVARYTVCHACRAGARR